MKRGEIYYIEKPAAFRESGSEQYSGRPAIIVSNDKCNENSEVLEVVYLTTQPKTDLPTHIDIRSSTRPSIALCEQITSVGIDRFGDYIGTCTDYEMIMVDAALAISLGLNFDKPKEKDNKKELVAEIKIDEKELQKMVDEKVDEVIDDLNRQICVACTERDTYKALYESLFERMVAR